MATQPETAVGSDAGPIGDAGEPTIENRISNAFSEMLEDDSPPPKPDDDATLQEDDGDGEEADPDADDDELEADEAEDGDEPPIKPPVSLTAEEQEAFKTWPRDAQETFTKRIGDMEKGLYAKTREFTEEKQRIEA